MQEKDNNQISEITETELSEYKDITTSVNNLTSKVENFVQDYNENISKVSNLIRQKSNLAISEMNHLSNKFQDFNIAPGLIPSYMASNKSFVGTNKTINNLYTKSLTSRDAEGNFIVPTVMFEDIVREIHDISPMRQLCSVEYISTGNALEMILESEGEFDVHWVGEEEERINTKNPKLSKISIPLHEMYAMPTITLRLLEDASFNVLEWLKVSLVDRFSKTENNSFILGDGDKKPQGIFTQVGKDNGIEMLALEDGSLFDGIYKLVNSLNCYYHKNAKFLINRKALSILQNIKDNYGRFLWQTSISEKISDVLLGYPVIPIEENMSQDDKPIILFGDFKKAYKIVERKKDMQILVDMYSKKPYVHFYATKRVGGALVDKNALKALKLEVSADKDE